LSASALSSFTDTNKSLTLSIGSNTDINVSTFTTGQDVTTGMAYDGSSNLIAGHEYIFDTLTLHVQTV